MVYITDGKVVRSMVLQICWGFFFVWYTSIHFFFFFKEREIKSLDSWMVNVCESPDQGALQLLWMCFCEILCYFVLSDSEPFCFLFSVCFVSPNFQIDILCLSQRRLWHIMVILPTHSLIQIKKRHEKRILTPKSSYKRNISFWIARGGNPHCLKFFLLISRRQGRSFCSESFF